MVYTKKSETSIYVPDSIVILAIRDYNEHELNLSYAQSQTFLPV